ncbi:MAG: chloride channel protein [Candidatus Acidiferrales bacterium]
MSQVASPTPHAPDSSGATAVAGVTPGRIQSLWQFWTLQIFSGSEDRLFLFLAILIGIFSGLAAVCFRVAIEWTQFALLGSNLSPTIPRVFLAPAIAGIGIALLVILAFPRARGSGVNQTKAAVYVLNGYIPFSTVIGKFIICALAIGSGQSLGPEDPSLQMGAGIASAIGRALRLSQKKIRLIAPVGAAAGLAAAFNAPISAVVFVIEEVIGTWSAGVLGAIVLAAVSSVVTMRWFLGPEPLFRVPPIRVAHPSEFLAYAVLGVVGGVASLLFLKWIAHARPRIQTLPAWTRFFQPAAAGLIIGLIGIKLPQVMGAGYPIIDQALHAQFAWKLLLLLAGMKILATGISFLSGTPGGMFAPTLFIGAMLGGAVGAIEHHFFPTLTATIGTFALVGMGTFFAGFLRAPITSIFMVIEVSGNYSVALPVMVSSLIAYLISRRFQDVPLFDMLSRQEGLVLPSIEERREQVSLVVEDAMQTDIAIVADPAEQISALVGRSEAHPQSPILVRVRMGEWRLLKREEIQPLTADPLNSHTVGDVAAKGPLPMIFPDESLEEVLRWAGDWPVLPVVNRADLGKLEGILSLSDILHAFRQSAE